ncbi:Abi family protein [Lysinibacillus macroides]|uniref:Abi family protein n=1 Tax=Lysinibacillus macroides TaxID=33935 RepID=UPI0006B67392|nr:Abi family protein [Lysinibacillus macroides]QPR68001.1 Abi family protein [Lysinibacillus macroides]
MQKTFSKKFKTFEEQINLLKDRGLSIKDEKKAVDLLSKKNYFDVINGFETLLLKDPKAANKEYNSETHFDQFMELYNFDKMFSAIVFKAIDSFENRLKTSIAYRFCESVFNSNPNANPACYMDILMYENPFSIHNRLNTLQPGRITQKFVNDINYEINRFINREIVNIESKITTINSSAVQYITSKARKRLLKAMNNVNNSISKTNSVITAINNDISLTPSVRGSGDRVTNITYFTNPLSVSLLKVSSSVVNPNTIENTIQSFIKDLQELNIRLDKIYSQVAMNSNTAIHTVPHFELKNFVGHNLFKTNHDNKDNNYIDSSKAKYNYLQKFEVPPFWVIIKTLELGSVLKLMYGLKTSILDMVVQDMGLNPTEKHILFNSTKIITDLRNHCAHFGLVNRFRTKHHIKINTDLINKLNLKTKSDGNSHYEIRLYDTLHVLAQFTSLNEISSLFKEFFMSPDCLIDSKLLMKLLDRMGNDNFLNWCSF